MSGAKRYVSEFVYLRINTDILIVYQKNEPRKKAIKKYMIIFDKFLKESYSAKKHRIYYT